MCFVSSAEEEEETDVIRSTHTLYKIYLERQSGVSYIYDLWQCKRWIKASHTHTRHAHKARGATNVKSKSNASAQFGSRTVDVVTNST